MIGCTQKQRAVVAALGLQDGAARSRILPDNAGNTWRHQQGASSVNLGGGISDVSIYRT
ncbi:MAG: hypothetical protein MZU95_15030 [Desulfomicrobium escambiense]|nr:hypothetical protein [Desulfomicrobium escambiense]